MSEFELSGPCQQEEAWETEHEYIYRLKQGWKLSIGRKGSKYYFAEYFADKTYESYGLVVALAKRDHWLMVNPGFLKQKAREECASGKGGAKTRGRPPATGHQGIYISSSKTGQSYIGSYRCEDGRLRTAKFSTTKFGRDLALQMAIEARLFFEKTRGKEPLNRAEFIITRLEAHHAGTEGSGAFMRSARDKNKD